jgi:hypothetical protein
VLVRMKVVAKATASEMAIGERGRENMMTGAGQGKTEF